MPELCNIIIDLWIEKKVKPITKSSYIILTLYHCRMKEHSNKVQQGHHPTSCWTSCFLDFTNTQFYKYHKSLQVHSKFDVSQMYYLQFYESCNNWQTQAQNLSQIFIIYMQNLTSEASEEFPQATRNNSWKQCKPGHQTSYSLMLGQIVTNECEKDSISANTYTHTHTEQDF